MTRKRGKKRGHVCSPWHPAQGGLSPLAPGGGGPERRSLPRGSPAYTSHTCGAGLLRGLRIESGVRPRDGRNTLALQRVHPRQSLFRRMVPALSLKGRTEIAHAAVSAHWGMGIPAKLNAHSVPSPQHTVARSANSAPHRRINFRIADQPGARARHNAFLRLFFTTSNAAMIFE